MNHHCKRISRGRKAQKEPDLLDKRAEGEEKLRHLRGMTIFGNTESEDNWAPS
jgi:hypothetical protein